MADRSLFQQPEFKAAFLASERQERLGTGKIASALVFFLMPFGTILDYFVYRHYIPLFLLLRLVCSALVGVVWYLHTTSLGHRYYKALGLPIALLPAFFITWMIYETDGPASPYYAGLNLVLLAVSVVVHWSVRESLVAVCSVLLMYSVACIFKGTQGQLSIIFNNFYFLGLTGLTVVTGNHFFNRLRFREFALRFELDQNKKVLEESNQKLKELDQIKGRFFANVSHELRTPLTLLIAPLETLLHRFNFDPDTKNLLGTMQANGMRLLKLINDLLDLVRLESGRMEVRQDAVDIAEFAKAIASAARQVAEDKRLRLETFIAPELGTVFVDRDKLDKIVLNLVFNAIKFTPSGGRVELRAEKLGEQFSLSVTDTGMGISAKNLEHVFDRFWQADDSSKRKFQGMGIGLALVKELAEIQGGKVEVKSQEGKGTTFSVLLPYRKAEPAPRTEPKVAPEPAPEAAPVNGGSRGTVSSEEWLVNLYRRAELFPALTPVQDSMRPVETMAHGNLPTILVADDEPDMLRFLKSQLSSHYRVLEAVDGQQAVDKAGQFLPDLILLDMMMPEKDGMQACREIRQRTSTQSIPVVLLTARADEDTKLAALAAGASDFLTKPFSTTELHVRLKNLVESYQYQRKLSKQNQALESTIEQLKETETQLVQSEKLASLGRMSAGIIHEINNPLNFATTGLFTLRNKGKHLAADQQEEYQEILKDVEDGIKRVKTIVSDLRMFTHPDTESRDQVEVADIVTTSLRFLSNELKHTVQIEQNLAAHQTIWANKNKLIHVLVNLLQNSLDALKTKSFDGEVTPQVVGQASHLPPGRLAPGSANAGETPGVTGETPAPLPERLHGEKPTIWIESRLEPGKSILVVRDNGTGIDKENLDKIFDPFFTTKDVGEGMGLGLAICYRIVQDCDGHIAVRTEPGKFCEFSLEFPDKGPA